MEKKAQAALEFMTTYGWTLLIIIAVVGIIAYNFTDLHKTVPNECTFNKVHCENFAVSPVVDYSSGFAINGVIYYGSYNKLEFEFDNTYSNPITIENVSLNIENKSIIYSCSANQNKIRPGYTAKITCIICSQIKAHYCKADLGQRLIDTIDISLKIKEDNKQFVKVDKGQILIKVEKALDEKPDGFCTTDSDCEEGEFCYITNFKGECKKPAGLGEYCDSEFICSNGLVCENSICLADLFSPCKSNKDCSKQLVCFNDICLKPFGEQCDENKECKSNFCEETCRAGINDNCSTHEDCAGFGKTTICYGGVCKYIIDVNCESNDECATGFCKNQQCFANIALAECQNEKDDDHDHFIDAFDVGCYCNFNSEAKSCQLNDVCYNDEDCDDCVDNLICSNNKCLKPIGSDCKFDKDCSTNNCYNQVCLLSAGSPCKTNDECQSSVCEKNTCLAGIGEACSNHQECVGFGKTTICYGGVCKGVNSDAICTKKDDCISNNCDKNHCVPMELKEECRNEKDDDADNSIDAFDVGCYCNFKREAKSCQLNDVCYNDKDCINELVCKNFKCISK